MLWGLDRASTRKLVSALGGPGDVVDEVYRVTGGNPKAVDELASLGWRTREWLERIEKRERLILAGLLPGHRRLCGKSWRTLTASPTTPS